jgi:C-terminal processing protease CtpA/Prc
MNRELPPPQYERPNNVSQIKDNVYYVNLCKANMEEIEDQIQDISTATGVVFDLRGYPNSNHDVISYMIDYPVRSAKWNIPEIVYPDHENIAGYDTSGRWTIEPKQPRIQGKIVFITNNSAISYAESIMGIIENYKLAEIIGSATAGANGNVNSVTTMGGYRFQWTGVKVLKHDDSQHHLIGIKPTIALEPTINGIREGKDELLEKAIEIITD